MCCLSFIYNYFLFTKEYMECNETTIEVVNTEIKPLKYITPPQSPTFLPQTSNLTQEEFRFEFIDKSELKNPS
jgi:hypothetical protein